MLLTDTPGPSMLVTSWAGLTMLVVTSWLRAAPGTSARSRRTTRVLGFHRVINPSKGMFRGVVGNDRGFMQNRRSVWGRDDTRIEPRGVILDSSWTDARKKTDKSSISTHG